MNKDRTSGWDPAYEWKAVALLSLGFGLVGIDRFMIMPLFPVMMKDLGFDSRISATSPARWSSDL